MKFLLLTLLGLLFADRLRADTWDNLATKRYYSRNSRFFIDVVPTKTPDKYGDYRRAKFRGKSLKKFKASDTIIVPCTGTFYKIIQKDTIRVWSRQLINDFAPSRVKISNDGSFVTTFDNWGSLGYGPDVFAIYNKDGDLLKRYALDDISLFPLNSYTKSISSIWWLFSAIFDDDSTEIDLCFVDKEGEKKCRIYNLTYLAFDN